jgi:hypothetical protein
MASTSTMLGQEFKQVINYLDLLEYKYMWVLFQVDWRIQEERRGIVAAH